MNNELTQGDIDKMQAEIDYLESTVHPKKVQDIQEARALGDLSENYEYKTAKRELGLCNSRIRYLKRMISTAHIVKTGADSDGIGIYDKIKILCEDEDEPEWIEIATTVRQDVLSEVPRIGNTSPMGKALLGHKKGEHVTVKADSGYTYDVEILEIEKCTGDSDAPINSY